MKRTRRPRPAPTARGPARTAVVTVESIAAGGDGVARADGMVVFVPRTAPGDVVEIELVPGARFARGALRTLRTPSPDRVEPKCPHYTNDKCGGCQLQHIAYDAQVEAKVRIVSDALERIGRREAPLPKRLPAREPWHYRRKLTLAMRRRDGRWVAGLHPYDSPDSIFALRVCAITRDDVLAVWREVLAAQDDLPDADALRGAVLAFQQGASFALEGGSSWPRSDAFFARVPSLVSVWWTPEGGSRRRLHVRGEEPVPGGSFAQVNDGIATAMNFMVTQCAMNPFPRTVIDAYAGIGANAIAIASLGPRVTAIEMDADASAWCGARLPEGSRAIAARVEDVLPDLLPADAVILNPPRVGVHERVTEALDRAADSVKNLIYVSCDPATLARDLRRLPSWRLVGTTCLDMFPQTAHVETIAVLDPVHP